jgi:hypothetical protein
LLVQPSYPTKILITGDFVNKVSGSLSQLPHLSNSSATQSAFASSPPLQTFPLPSVSNPPSRQFKRSPERFEVKPERVSNESKTPDVQKKKHSEFYERFKNELELDELPDVNQAGARQPYEPYYQREEATVGTKELYLFTQAKEKWQAQQQHQLPQVGKTKNLS